MVTEEILRLATDRLVEQFRPQRVILFGSQARGTADARSDVDLLVICPVPPGQGSRRALMVAMDRALLGRAVTGCRRAQPLCDHGKISGRGSRG